MFKAAFLVVASVTLFSEYGFAWADRGHQIVGQIAEENVKPATKDFIRGVLGLEPLSVAATFPDHVKDDPRFAHREKDPAKQEHDIHDFGDFHFCEIPVGSTYDTNVKKFPKDCFGVIKGAIEILKQPGNSEASKVEKQIALRYLTHVMGDIGNPLHVGNGLDRGGNSCKVKWQPNGKVAEVATNLHAAWDDLLIVHLGQTYEDPAKKRRAAIYMGDYMINIRERHKDLLSEAGKNKFGAGDLQSWLLESAELREGGMYPGSKEARERKYCLVYSDQGSGTVEPGSVVDEAAIPTLDKAYADKYAPVAEMQMVKTGLRLASVLDSIAESAAKSQPAAPTMSELEQDAILRAVQSKFKNKIQK